MCGRYSLFVPPEDLSEEFDVSISEYEPRYNAAPGQSLPVVTDAEDDVLQQMEWGLIPSWTESRDDGGQINARAETLAEKASFRDAFRQASDGPHRAGRCLVPADGFYEWASVDGHKQPYRITLDDERPFAMAGLWAEWQPPTTQTGLDVFTEGGTTDTEQNRLQTFTIVTTAPNDLVGQYHDRMAVVLPADERRQWLRNSPMEAQELLRPYPSEKMQAYPISHSVNDPSNDSPAVIERVGPETAENEKP